MHIERPLVCASPSLSHVRFPISTTPQQRISLHETSRPSGGIAVDDPANGAIFYLLSQLDIPFQRDRYAILGVESGLTC